MRFVICVVLLVLTPVGAVVMDGGNPLAYVGIPGLLMAVLVPFFAMLAVFKGSDLQVACRDAFGSARRASSRARSVDVWGFAEKACYAAGVLAWLTAVILALISQSLRRDTPHFERDLATTLVAPIYAVILALVCRILRARVQQRAG